MRVRSLRLKNFRCFDDTGLIPFGSINILVGQNNAGKSTILRALHFIQEGCGDWIPDLRVGTDRGTIEIMLDEMRGFSALTAGQSGDTGKLFLTLAKGIGGQVDNLKFQHNVGSGSLTDTRPLKPIEPDHFVVPYLSRRKVVGYQEDVRNEQALKISSNFDNLTAKLSRLVNPTFPGHELYRNACKAILGFEVYPISSTNGQRPGIFLPGGKGIYIEQMGEGVPSIAMLLANLAVSEGKLFLIEEPENDLHPTALKAMLDLIVESSKSNQFVISTHSNIVVRHLAGVADSQLYSITSVFGQQPPTANIKAIEPTVEARLNLLTELGYSFSDFDLWDGWLFLEESSAERIIRDYLIPWFAPKLSRVRTLAVGGNSQIEPSFEDFSRMVRFTHLEELYRNAAWVRVDGDDSGNQIIARLRARYTSWEPDRFSTFNNSQFEQYYPSHFAQKIAAVLALIGKQEKRTAKKELLDEVRAWLDEDDERAKVALQESAAEIIADLQVIEAQLISK